MRFTPAYRVDPIILRSNTTRGTIRFAKSDASFSLSLAPIYQGPKGDKGDPGDAGIGSSYTHTQASPSASWVITHNLGFRPTVYVTDTAGDECVGDVLHNSTSQLTITFSASFAGQARLM